MDLDGHKNCVTTVVFTSDGSKIVSGSADHTIKLWDGITGEYLSPLESHTNCITSIAISAGDKYIVSSSSDHTIKIWDIETKRVLHEKRFERGQINSVTCINDPIGVVYNENKSIGLWRYESNYTEMLYDHNAIVKCCKYADGYVASGSDDGEIKVWKSSTRSLYSVFAPDSPPVVSIALCNFKMIAAFENCSIRVWRLNEKSCSVTGKISNCDVKINCITFTHDSNATIFGSKNCSLKIVRHVSEEGFMTDCLLLPSEACSVACNHNTSKLVAGFVDGKLTMWDIKSDLKFLPKENVVTGNIEELSSQCELLANRLDSLKRELADVSNEREVVESLLKQERTEMVVLQSQTDEVVKSKAEVEELLRQKRAEMVALKDEMVKSKAEVEDAIRKLRLEYDNLKLSADEELSLSNQTTKDFQFKNSSNQSLSIKGAVGFIADGIWSGLFTENYNFTLYKRHVIVKESITSRLRDIKSESNILKKLNENEDSCCVKLYGMNFEAKPQFIVLEHFGCCLLYTSPSPRDRTRSRMPSSA